MTGSGDEAWQHRSTRLRAGLLAVAVATALLVGGGSPAGASPAPAGAVAAGGYLYWTNLAPLRKGAGTIGRARLDGTDVNQHFIAVPNGPSGVAGLAVNCRYIYWTNEDGNEIGRANLNGTGVNQKFITGADFPDAIAAGSQYLYWANAFGKTIGRARLNGTDVNQRFIANKDFINLHGVAVGPGRLPLIDHAAAPCTRRLTRVMVGGPALPAVFDKAPSCHGRVTESAGSRITGTGGAGLPVRALAMLLAASQRRRR
jgi:hypothetical protein